MEIETLILKGLLVNENYARRVLPFLKEEYFGKEFGTLYKHSSDFYEKYNSKPTEEMLAAEVTKEHGLSEFEVTKIGETLQEIKESRNTDINEDWLITKTEEFCQERALYNAVGRAVSIMDGKDKTLNKGSIPSLLQEALSVCFDAKVGHDYIEDSDDRFEYYHRHLERIAFDLEYMNKITNKGTPKKTLNIVMAGTGIGKTIFLCHHAAACLSAGLDVLYITLEMSEEEISKRIDANLLNVSMDDLLLIPKADYDRRMSKLKSHNAEVGGKLIVKEYPTASASVTNFRHLLNELKLKKNFKPAIIFVDYLNICTSSRIKAGSNVNSYTYVKSIAEELRGLAVEYDVPVWSATQLNRSGYADSDPEMDQTSESFGLPMTVDFLMILVSSEELESLNQLMVKQVKNRYRDVNKDKRFVIGLDKDKMRFHDVAASEQNLAVKKGESAEETPWEVPKSGSRKPKLVEGVKY